MTDGEKLKKILKEKNLVQATLADKMGIPKSTLNRWMRSSSLYTNDIQKVMNALGMELWEFFIDDKVLAKKNKISPEMLAIAKQIEKMPPDFQYVLLEMLSKFISLSFEIQKNR